MFCMYHGEAVSKEGAVLLEKVDCLWTFVTHMFRMSVFWWHYGILINSM